MPTRVELDEIQKLHQELDSIAHDSELLFQQVPLVPEAEQLAADGKTVEAYVLRWHSSDVQAVKSDELAVRYETWYQKALMFVHKYVPSQEDSFKHTGQIMHSYVTLNRYAVATPEMLANAEQEYERGYVTVYLREFASVIDSHKKILRSITAIPERKLLPQPRCFITGQKCTVPVWSNPRLVFAILPFSEEYDEIYELGIKWTVESLGWECKRGDEIIHTQNIVCVGICQPIRSARCVVAELSVRNPNVLYELGLSHAFEKDVIVITRNAENIPFDLRNQNVVIYEEVNDLRNKFESMLHSLNR
jgi:hypothetical protein